MEDDPWGEEFSDEALSISSDDGKGQEKEFDPLAKHKHRYSEKDFRLEEDMSDEEKSRYFLAADRHPLQHRVGVSLVGSILKSDPDRGAALVPCLCEFLARINGPKDTGLLVLGGEMMLSAGESGTLSQTIAAESTMKVSKLLLTDSKSSDVVLIWAKVLSTVVGVLAYDVVRDEVMTLALTLGEVSMPLGKRLASSSLLPALFATLSMVDVTSVHPVMRGRPVKQRSTLWDRALELCQDTEHTVRASLSRGLPLIAAAVCKKGAEGGKEVDSVLGGACEELMQLLCDEEVDVRDAAFGGVIEMMKCAQAASKHRSDLARGISAAYAKGGDDELLAKHAAMVLVSFSGGGDGAASSRVAPHTAVEAFLCNKAPVGDMTESARRHLAYSSPALALHMGQKASMRLITLLSSDPSVVVKRALCIAVPGLVQAYGADGPAREQLRGVVMSLCSDPNEEVMRASLSCLGREGVLGLVLEEGTSGFKAVAKLHGALYPQDCTMVGWRDEAALLAAVRREAESVEKFTAMHSRLLDWVLGVTGRGGGGVLCAAPCVTSAGIQAACVLLRRCRNAGARIEICKGLVSDWASNDSWVRRRHFAVDICGGIRANFSRNFFKCFFLDAAMAAFHDPVANVRVGATSLIPSVRAVTRSPHDNLLLDAAISAEQRLLRDVDADVRAAAKFYIDIAVKQACSTQEEAEEEEKARDEMTVHGVLDRRLLVLQSASNKEMSDLTSRAASSHHAGMYHALPATSSAPGAKNLKASLFSKIPARRTASSALPKDRQRSVGAAAAGSPARTASTSSVNVAGSKPSPGSATAKGMSSLRLRTHSPEQSSGSKQAKTPSSAAAASSRSTLDAKISSGAGRLPLRSPETAPKTGLGAARSLPGGKE